MRLDTEYRFDGDAPRDEWDPIPAGWYPLTIREAEIKDTKAGNGKMLSIQTVVDGPNYNGRVVFANITLKNPNDKAVEIGRKQLDNLGRACGLSSLTDTDQLIGRRVEGKLTIQRSEEYGDQNEIRAYRARAGARPPAQQQPKFEPPAKPVSSDTPPWLQNRG